MNRIILADNQAIFRTGTARILAMEEDMRIAAQYAEVEPLLHALQTFRSSIVLFATSLHREFHKVLDEILRAEGKAILITENHEEIALDALAKLDGVMQRNITGHDLVHCVRTVAQGKRSMHFSYLNEDKHTIDMVGTRVRDRLTPREMQIVALIVQGCKNKEIATRLSVTEQVVKNYLRSIYDKSGVSDRLELALFTIHHRILADAANKAGNHLHLSERQTA
ncbi:MAG: response regulator transcription factor [Acidobacteriaceae bacterium]